MTDTEWQEQMENFEIEFGIADLCFTPEEPKPWKPPARLYDDYS